MSNLVDVFNAQLEVARHRGDVDVSMAVIPLIICVDATSLWRSSATRCDVLVQCGKKMCDLGGWSSWWVMDGGDDHHALEGLDHIRLHLFF